eukprot:5712506-Prymnesium_polylepis.1
MQRGSAGHTDGGQTARTAAGSGRECTVGGGRRQRTSSGRTLRRTGRCCRRDVAVPANPTLESALHSAQVERLWFGSRSMCRGGSFYAERRLGVEECVKTPRPVIAHTLLRLERELQPWMAARARWSSAATLTSYRESKRRRRVRSTTSVRYS